VHRKLPHLGLGDWVPGRTNYLLLAVQVLFAVQGAARGMDYVLPRPPMPTPASLTSIEAAFPLPVWGVGFLLAGGAVLVGLFGGWLTCIVIGHFLLAGLYGAFAYGILADAPVDSYLVAGGGALLLAGGLHLGLRRWPRWEKSRFAAAMILTGIGGWVCGLGLGYNFRTGTGILIAGMVHATFVVGLLYIAARVPARRGR
jgi:hypothetical protein